MIEIPLIAFSIDRNSRLSLQKQIQTCVVQGISFGQFDNGAKMPSSRALAEYLGISRITVTLAYVELASIGYLEAKDRSGYFVALSEDVEFPASMIAPQQTVPAYEPNFARRYTRFENKLVRPRNWRDYPYCFIYGQADPSVIDHYRWRQCSLEALGRRDFDSLALDSYESDDPMLVEGLLSMNLQRRGIKAKEDEVLVTMGALNALWLCAQLFLDKDKTAIIENPCYPTLRAMLMNRECMVDSIDVDEKGLSAERIPASANVVFTTPSHQSPTNVPMSIDRRKKLIKCAKEGNFLIVEDDYEFENQLKGTPKPALKSLDEDGHVIYVGSFSKSLFPGLRLGYMVASKEIIAEARALRGLVLRNPPNHTQRTVAYFQSLGYYDRQLKRLARTLRERHQIMRESIERNGLEFASSPDLGGSSFWMKTNEHIDTQILGETLLKKGVLIEAGAPFFAPEKGPQNYYRLAFSSVEREKIDAGIGLIAKAIQDYEK